MRLHVCAVHYSVFGFVQGLMLCPFSNIVIDYIPDIFIQNIRIERIKLGVEGGVELGMSLIDMASFAVRLYY